MGNVQIRRNSVRIRVSDGFDSKTNTRRFTSMRFTRISLKKVYALTTNTNAV